MQQVVSHFYQLIVKEIKHRKIRETYYLWFPWLNLLFAFIARMLVGKLPFEDLLQFEKFEYSLVFWLLFACVLLKCAAIVRYSSVVGKEMSKVSHVWLFLYHIIPSFFLIWLFYQAWNTWNIVPFFILDICVSFFGDKVLKFKVYAHILTDIISIILLLFVDFEFDRIGLEFRTDFLGIFFCILFVTFRYLLVSNFYRGFKQFKLFSLRWNNGKIYWFSELVSSMLFLVVFHAGLETIDQDFSFISIALSLFVYHIFLYIRLFMYRQYGASYKEVYYFVNAGSALVLYIFFVNFIAIDIVVWFLPAVIILVLDNFLYLAYQQRTKQPQEFSLGGKQLFAKLKLFSITTLFFYHVFDKNRETLFAYRIFGYSLNDLNSVFLREYASLPFLSLILSVVVSTAIFKLIGSVLYSNDYLLKKGNSKKLKYKKRLRRRK